jgi:sugar phosphate isomerase/epimerase
VPEVIDSLRQAGYAGWVVIEQDTTPDDPTQVADRNRHYLEPLIK